MPSPVGPVNAQSAPCVLKITPARKRLKIEDVDGFCRTMYCGERGGFGSGQDVSYPYTWRREIRYMPRLLASKVYKQALVEHNSHSVGTPTRAPY